MGHHFIILTGEYPPDVGGVADYTYQLAQGLCSAGEGVTVFTPPASTGPSRDAHSAGSVSPDVQVLPDHWGRRSRASVQRFVSSLSTPAIVLIQYVPQAMGARSMNVMFARWVGTLSSSQAGRPSRRVIVMFHEVAFPLIAGQPFRHRLLAHAHRWMARKLVEGSDRVLVSTAAWESLLKEIAPRFSGAECLPVPSNLPTTLVADIQSSPAETPNAGHECIGYFGTFSSAHREMLGEVIPRLLNPKPTRRFMLIGKGSTTFRGEIVASHPQLADRITASGEVAPLMAAASIRACTVMVQPYIEGVTTRRSTIMASLALGKAVVTTTGKLTEPLWSESGACVLCQFAANAITDACERLLCNDEHRRRLEQRAIQTYRQRFDMSHTVRRIREIAGELMSK